MLGKILEIKNNYLIMENDNAKSDVINFYVKIIDIDNTFIGEIEDYNRENITIKLIGELENKKFIYGLKKKPTFEAKIELLNSEEIKILFGSFSYHPKKSLYLGKSAIYEDEVIYADMNNLFSNHLAILGNTGSGKSCGMARILQNLFYKQDSNPAKATFFIIDAYGEYKNAFKMINYVHPELTYKNYSSRLTKEEEILPIPLWLLSLDDICILLEVNDKNQIPIVEKALTIVNIFNRDEEEVIKYKNNIIAKALLDIIINGNTPAQIRDQIFSVLTRYNTKELNLETPIYMPGYTRPLKQCLIIDESGKIREMELVVNFLNSYILEEMDVALPDGTFKYTLKDLLYAFDFALIDEGILNDKKVYSLAHSLRVRLASIVNSEANKFFDFPNHFTKEEFMHMLTYKDDVKAQVINLNLEDIDDRFAKSIAKIYAKLIFDYNKNLEERATKPIHLILEEAHRYVQNDNDIMVLGYNIFERIAKEGRKYAVLLSLISQRPSELSQTVLSQCNNFIIFRVTHPVDINFLKAVIPYVSDDVIEKIKNLPTGNCLTFGLAFNLPTLIKVDMATPAPLSESCNISNAWFQ